MNTDLTSQARSTLPPRRSTPNPDQVLAQVIRDATPPPPSSKPKRSPATKANGRWRGGRRRIHPPSGWRIGHDFEGQTSEEIIAQYYGGNEDTLSNQVTSEDGKSSEGRNRRERSTSSERLEREYEEDLDEIYGPVDEEDKREMERVVHQMDVRMALIYPDWIVRREGETMVEKNRRKKRQREKERNERPLKERRYWEKQLAEGRIDRAFFDFV